MLQPTHGSSQPRLVPSINLYKPPRLIPPPAPSKFSTADCPLCNDVLDTVRRVACDSCDVQVVRPPGRGGRRRVCSGRGCRQHTRLVLPGPGRGGRTSPRRRHRNPTASAPIVLLSKGVRYPKPEGSIGKPKKHHSNIDLVINCVLPSEGEPSGERSVQSITKSFSPILVRQSVS